MKVRNMTSNRTGREVPNQFIITDQNRTWFQSYRSMIAKKTIQCDQTKPDIVELDPYYWDYSKTTGRYRNQFLGETRKETEAKIKSGEYILTDLNS